MRGRVQDREFVVSEHETVSTTETDEALLGAIGELREAVGRMIEEQMELVLRGLDYAATVKTEPAPPPAPSVPATVAPPNLEPTSREPSEPIQAGDSRQRLDALAKLLDRRLKAPAPTPHDHPERGEDR